MFGASSDSSPSIGDRFSQLFGSKSQAVGELAASLPGGQRTRLPSGEHSRRRLDLSGGRRPASSRSATTCVIRRRSLAPRAIVRSAPATITARIGIQGRVIAAPPARRRPSRFRSGSRWCKAGQRADHRDQGLPDHGDDERGGIAPFTPGRRRYRLSRAIRRGRRFLHLLYRLRPQAPRRSRRRRRRGREGAGSARRSASAVAHGKKQSKSTKPAE